MVEGLAVPVLEYEQCPPFELYLQIKDKSAVRVNVTRDQSQLRMFPQLFRTEMFPD